MTRALLLAALLSGCATAATPAGATTALKLQDDAAALAHVAADVRAKCGGQFAPIAPLIASALMVAANPYDAVADVMAAVAAIPALAQDVRALECIAGVIRDDVRALEPAKPAPAAKATPWLDKPAG